MVINDMEEEEQLDVTNKVIVLPEDEKIEPVIDCYIIVPTILWNIYTLIIMADLMVSSTTNLICTY